MYGDKARQAGVAQRSLYGFVRHPQYLCLGVAGWGLLTSWPRFLLLGVWVTMLFQYAGLARLEERRMEERFGNDYREFAARRGSFLPGSPVHRLFGATFGRLRPRPVGWMAAYLFALALAFSLAFGLRAWTRASSTVAMHQDERLVMISVWPQPPEALATTVKLAAYDDRVRRELRQRAGRTAVVATVLPPDYPMRDMYYLVDPDRMTASSLRSGLDFPFLYRLLTMGRRPRPGDTVQVVFSRASKAYRRNLEPEEALDPGVQLMPLVVVDFAPDQGEIVGVRVPLPRNAWGADVVMPIF